MTLGNSTMLNVAATAGPGGILALIRSGEAVTRAQILAITGLSRSTVAQRLDALIAHGYIAPAATESSTGGRPAGAFQINADAGVMLLASIGAGAMQVAVCDMGRTILARQSHGVSVADGPIAVLGEVMAHFDQLLAEVKRTRADVKGIGIGVPGPVEFAEGRVVRPPIMTGWDGYRVPDFFAADYACPIVVDKDANLMALGEWRTSWPGVQDLMVLRMGMAISCGIIANGRVLRGSAGVAGDLEHIPNHDSTVLCRCGQRGCLTATASGEAIKRGLGPSAGAHIKQGRDIVDLLRTGGTDVTRLTLEAGTRIGTTLATAMSILNPDLVVLGGSLTQYPDLVDQIRTSAFNNVQPLTAISARIITSTIQQDAGLVGAAHLVLELVTDAPAVDAAIDSGVTLRT